MPFPRPALACAAALVVGATACRGGLAVEVPRVVVDTESVAFTEVATAVRHRAPLQVTNAGTRSVRVRFRAQEPLVVTPDSIFLGAKTTDSVQVIFTPTDYTDQALSVTVIVGEDNVVVPVSVSVDTDADADGFTAAGAGGDDCDDNRFDVKPGADEICDGVDNDCDEQIDEDPIDAIDVWPDADGDTWGALDGRESRCTAGDGFVARTGDCDDDDEWVHPAAREIVNARDDDCDGLIDEQLLMVGSLLINEVYLDPAGEVDAVPPYVELRVRATGTIHLDNVELALGGESLFIESGTATDGELLLLCGVETGATVDGAPCVAPLPAAPGASDALVIRAGEVEVDSVDWTGWGFPDDGALVLDPAAVTATDNDAPDLWCASDASMSNGDSGSPGSANASCDLGG